MGKFDNYIIISDLDGTLVKGNNYISEKNINAINYFQKEGGKFSIATGRSLNRVRFIKEIFNIDLPAIILNGSSIVNINDETILWEKFIHESVVEVINDFYLKHPQSGIIAFSKDKDYFINYEVFYEVLGNLNDFRFVDAKPSDIKNPINKVVFYSYSDILEYLNKEYSGYLDNLAFTKSDTNFYEIIDKTVSKGNALEHLRKICDLKNKKIITIGDNLNDYEMILKADLGVAVRHNCDKLYDIADIVVDNEDVMCSLINKLV